MAKNNLILNEAQLQVLQALFMHIWAVKFENAKNDYKFYANKLDQLNIPWHVQNTASILAGVRENMFFYFLPLLYKKLINSYDEVFFVK